jgi:hypothetical protein
MAFRSSAAADDWDTDPTFVNELTDGERLRFGNAETARAYREERAHGLIAAQSMDKIRGHAASVDAHRPAHGQTATDFARGYGGKFGLEADADQTTGGAAVFRSPLSAIRATTHQRVGAHSGATTLAGQARIHAKPQAGGAASSRRPSVGDPLSTRAILPLPATAQPAVEPPRADGSSVRAFVASGGVGAMRAEADERMRKSLGVASGGEAGTAPRPRPHSHGSVSARVAALVAAGGAPRPQPAAARGALTARDERPAAQASKPTHGSPAAHATNKPTKELPALACAAAWTRPSPPPAVASPLSPPPAAAAAAARWPPTEAAPAARTPITLSAAAVPSPAARTAPRPPQPPAAATVPYAFARPPPVQCAPRMPPTPPAAATAAVRPPTVQCAPRTPPTPPAAVPVATARPPPAARPPPVQCAPRMPPALPAAVPAAAVPVAAAPAAAARPPPVQCAPRMLPTSSADAAVPAAAVPAAAARTPPTPPVVAAAAAVAPKPAALTQPHAVTQPAALTQPHAVTQPAALTQPAAAGARGASAEAVPAAAPAALPLAAGRAHGSAASKLSTGAQLFNRQRRTVLPARVALAQQPPPPPSPPPAVLSAVGAPALWAGARVCVRTDAAARPALPAERNARVLSVRADGSVKLSFDGYDSDHDEWLPAAAQRERVRGLSDSEAAAGLAAATSATAHCLPPSRLELSSKQAAAASGAAARDDDDGWE